MKKKKVIVKRKKNSKQIPTCIKCGAVLTDENWYPSSKKKNSYICKKCNYELTKKW